jgi:hypothetical protein
MKVRRFVICIGNPGYTASLEPRKIYESLPDTDAQSRELIRVIDESGEDYLYPASLFIAIELPKSVQSAIVRAA